jgi:hypothetical protein
LAGRQAYPDFLYRRAHPFDLPTEFAARDGQMPANGELRNRWPEMVDVFSMAAIL